MKVNYEKLRPLTQELRSALCTNEAAAHLNLPIVGAMIVGADVGSGMSDQLLLTGGRVLVEASSAPFPSGQVSRETPLFAGDRLSLAGEIDDEVIPAHALARLGEDGQLRVTAHANAARALVVHYGQYYVSIWC